MVMQRKPGNVEAKVRDDIDDVAFCFLNIRFAQLMIKYVFRAILVKTIFLVLTCNKKKS